MNSLTFRSLVLIAACIAVRGGFAETISTVVDYVTLNGNNPSNFVNDTYRGDMTFEYDDDNQVWRTGRRGGAGNGLISESTIVDFEGKTGVLKVLSGGCGVSGTWQGPCVEYALDSGVPLKHAQIVSFPYYCASSGLNNKALRIVVRAGNKSFSVEANEKIVANAWTNAVFDLAGVYAELAANYAANKDANITRLRIYGGGFRDPTSSSETITVVSFPFDNGQAFYFGPVTYAYEEVSYYTVTLDTNGGVPIAPMQTDGNYQLTLPTPTREGFTFLGWYYSGSSTAAGTTIDVAMDCTYVAGWRRTDPSIGLSAGDSPYKKILDMYLANGSCNTIVDNLDVTITYFPAEDRYVHTSSASVTVTPLPDGSVTNVRVAASSTGSKWTTPFIHPRFSSLKLLDIYEVDVPYSYDGTSGNVIGKPLVFYYKIGSTWRHLSGEENFEATADGLIKVNVAKSLGADYQTLKDQTIDDMKFYFYGGTAGESGFNNAGWTIGGIFVFRPLELIAEHGSGFVIIVR